MYVKCIVGQLYDRSRLQPPRPPVAGQLTAGMVVAPREYDGGSPPPTTTHAQYETIDTAHALYTTIHSVEAAAVSFLFLAFSLSHVSQLNTHPPPPTHTQHTRPHTEEFTVT